MLLKPSFSSLFISCIVLVCPTFVLAGHEEEEHTVDPTSSEFWGQIIAIFFLVIVSGIVAGLTLGLMSLDATNLSILEIAGTPQQKHYASRIIPIRKNGHILLATLLLTNTVLNETLPILFDDIFSKGFVSVIVSTALLVLFAEIIPQAIFSKHGLAIGALFAYPVRILIALWFVISWPISKFLDFMLGKHAGFTYGVAEFSALAELHDISKHTQGTLEHGTVRVLQNVLCMQGKTAADIATTTGSMLLLQPSVMLNPSMVEQYLSSGYTHILVYEETGNDLDECRIRGVLELEALRLFREENFSESIGKMNLQSYLTASSREPVLDLMTQLLDKNTKEKVILVYRTESDISRIKEEQDALACEIALIQAATVKKHKSTLRCRFRRLCGLQCQICQSLPSSKESEKCDESSISSNPATTIGVELESGLIGMITTTGISNLLVTTHNMMDSQNFQKVSISKQPAMVGLNIVSK